ncbi:hypothetical protein [Marinospirillum perlucidum]|uniref:hypothetical protein n=1 Tax=Marinospirillum perlucidum TaxID=1982602 RepID=UPI000DF260C7|nr:hypothetical protein [Marinospirillum perlucidum]
MYRKLLTSLMLGSLVGLTGCQSLPKPEALTPEQTARGELTSASQLNYKDGSRYALYSVSLQEDQAFKAEISGNLEATLSVFNDCQDLLISGGSPLYFRSEEAGNYQLAVNGLSDASYGPYTLKLTEVEISNRTHLSGEESLTGWLGQDNLTTYTLSIEEAGVYEMAVSSSSFDTILEVRGPGGHFQDDDSGNSTNSRLSRPLEPGEYHLAVSGYDEGSTGLFELIINKLEVDLSSQESLEIPGTLNGWLPSGGTQTYQVSIDEAGIYQFNLTSLDFDTVLEVRSNTYFMQDDDGGDDTNSRLGDHLQAGEYVVAVSAYGDASGSFTLNAERLNIEVDNVSELTAPAEVNAWMGADPDVYTLTIEEAGQYLLEMRSSMLDSVLRVEGPNGVSQENDDGGSQRNSRMQVYLDAGEYTLTARSYDSSSGAYQLLVQPQ